MRSSVSSSISSAPGGALRGAATSVPCAGGVALLRARLHPAQAEMPPTAASNAQPGHQMPQELGSGWQSQFGHVEPERLEVQPVEVAPAPGLSPPAVARTAACILREGRPAPLSQRPSTEEGREREQGRESTDAATLYFGWQVVIARNNTSKKRSSSRSKTTRIDEKHPGQVITFSLLNISSRVRFAPLCDSSSFSSFSSVGDSGGCGAPGPGGGGSFVAW